MLHLQTLTNKGGMPSRGTRPLKSNISELTMKCNVMWPMRSVK